jgi:hypothetical protein
MRIALRWDDASRERLLFYFSTAQVLMHITRANRTRQRPHSCGTIVEQRTPISILINNRLTISFKDCIFTTAKMMISRSCINITANVEGSSTSVSPFVSPQKIRTHIAGTFRRVMPRMRDREVPYGMKGGEHNGHKES